MSTQTIKFTNKFIYSFKNKDQNFVNLIPLDIIEKIEKINKQILKSNNFTLKKNKRYIVHKNNGWQKVVRKKIFNGDNLDNRELLQRKINGTLNKINKENFDLIKNDILNLIEKSTEKENTLDFVINCLFQKAIKQQSYCYLYVKLYQNLINKISIYTDIMTNILIQKCNSFMDIFDSKPNLDTENSKNSELICQIIEQKKYIYGYSMLMVELFNKQVIRFSLLKIFIDKLFINILEKRGNNEYEIFIELNIESISLILTKIHLEKKDNNEISIIKKYLECLREYKNKTNLSSKIKFKILDILEIYQ